MSEAALPSVFVNSERDSRLNSTSEFLIIDLAGSCVVQGHFALLIFCRFCCSVDCSDGSRASTICASECDLLGMLMLSMKGVSTGAVIATLIVGIE